MPPLFYLLGKWEWIELVDLVLADIVVGFFGATSEHALEHQKW
jgi:hypothetical protein